MPRPAAVHRTAIVAPGVEVGEGTVIGPYAVVLAPCTIGRDCWIGPHVVIGATGEHVDEMIVQRVPEGATEVTDEEIWFGAHGVGVVIGERTIVREQATIQSGTAAPTTVGSDVFMMNKSHVAHDCVLGDRVRMAPTATLGGHVWIGDDANVGMGAAVHQQRTIGTAVMVGMQAGVVKDIRPYELVKGVPARPTGLNEVWLRRAGHSDDDVADLARFYAGGSEDVPEPFAAALTAWETARRR
ncbi:MAG: hypothetical protein MUE36_00420 [Acidimicrobiales bacterium]|jgi:UDP-N-acetylglucosamine acyltransferase|nr:hypothetical protein [Acidimicrobiales bacterium]